MAKKKGKKKTLKNKNSKAKEILKKKRKIARKKKILKIKKNIKKIIKSKINKIKKKLKNKKKKIKINKQKDIKLTRDEIEEEAKKEEEIKERSVLNQSIEISRKIGYKLAISIVVVGFVCSMIYLILNNSKDDVVEFIDIDYLGYKELYKKDNLEYIYITENDCTYCELLEPYLMDLQEEYDIELKSLNISNLTNEELEELKDSNSVFEGELEAPILISIKDGKEISNVKGYKEYEVLKKFVNYSENPGESTSFIKINIDQYLEILNSEDLSVIYICRNNSKSCEKYSPTLESISLEREITVYYLNTDTLDTRTEWEKLENSNEIFSKMWFVPTTIVTKNGEIVSYKMETMNSAKLSSFFKKSGL